jgi:Flp pilus assembly protein TadB
MRKKRLYYITGGAGAGLLLMGMGWAFSSFYLVVAGAVVIAAAVAWMTVPMPTLY